MYLSRPDEWAQHLPDVERLVQSLAFSKLEASHSDLDQLSRVDIHLSPVDATAYESLKQRVLSTMQARGSFKSRLLVRDETDSKLAQHDYAVIEWQMTFQSPESFEIIQNHYQEGVGDIWRVVGDEMYINVGLWMPMPKTVPSDEMNQMLQSRRDIYKQLSFGKYLQLFQNEQPSGISENVQDQYTVVQFRRDQAEDLLTGSPRPGSLTTETLVWVDNQDHAIRFVKTQIRGTGPEGKSVQETHRHSFVNYDASFALGRPETKM